MKKFLMMMLCTTVAISAQATEVDNILVEKYARKMYLRSGEDVLKTYNIFLGPNPEGHKQQSGDGRTPEGRYTISGRNPNSKYHLSLRISYPNDKDCAEAAKKGVSPGGDIMIHGTPNKVPGFLFRFRRKKDWTAGCIAVSDAEIEEIWDLVPNGTEIVIKP